MYNGTTHTAGPVRKTGGEAYRGLPQPMFGIVLLLNCPKFLIVLHQPRNTERAGFCGVRPRGLQIHLYHRWQTLHCIHDWRTK